MEKLTDSSKMPFGKFKDKNMIDVPAWYLILFYNDNQKKKLFGKGKQVMDYIEDNIEVIEAEYDREETAKNQRRMLRYGG